MNWRVNPNIIKTSHPFSALMGTLTGFIIAWKFLGNTEVIYEFGLIFGIAQFLTGITNDYIDFEDDSKFQPLKITSREGISRDEIKPFIILSSFLLFILSILLFPLDIALIILTGTILAQSYNFKFKDHPFSGLIFVTSFGFMALSSYILKFGYDLESIPLKFLFSGFVIALGAHIANDLVDYEIDIQRNSRSFTVSIGRKHALILSVTLYLILAILHISQLLVGVLSILSIMSFFFLRTPSYKKRELIYYFVASISLVILFLIPIN